MKETALVKEAERVAAAASAPTYEDIIATRRGGAPRTSPMYALEVGVPVRYWGKQSSNAQDVHLRGFQAHRDSRFNALD